jgi:hypothetical protein
MTPLDNARWSAETDAFVRKFLADRAAWWDAHGRGDLDETAPIEPWTDVQRDVDDLPVAGADAAVEIVATFFPDKFAYSKTEETVFLATLADRIRVPHAARKDALPLIKFARFGGAKTKTGSTRFDANVLQITGVEGDYDGELIPFDRAVEIAEQAGLRCIVYTSPSYTPGKPRWRVLAPTSRPLPKERRMQLMDRLNGAYAGAFQTESWTLSQSFYIGFVSTDGRPNPHHQVVLIYGEPIDLLDVLDAIAIGRPGASRRAAGETGPIGNEPRGDAELIAAIVTGEQYHNELLALAARYSGRGMAPEQVGNTLRGFMLGVPEALRDDRWPDRFNSIHQIVASARQKFVAGAEQRRAIARTTHRLADRHRPASEIKAAVLTEAERLGIAPDAALGLAGEILKTKATANV